MANEFNRQLSLVVSNQSEAIELSQFRVKFSVKQSDFQTPNDAVIRVYNLADTTVQQLSTEFQTVTLKAGYQDPTTFGLIFTGTIKQTRRGKERNVDSFIDISAADGDLAYNWGFMNSTLSAGYTRAQELQSINAALGLKQGYTMDLPPTAASRGKVQFGLAREYARIFAQTNNASWSIQHGATNLVPLTGYIPGQAVVVNSLTGMVGVPEITQDGIRVRTLLNPNIKIGGLIQLNNRDVTGGLLEGQILRTPGRLDGAFGQPPVTPNQLPVLAPSNGRGDGFYKVLVSEFTGDTRGNDWYSDVICLAVSISDPAANSVALAG